MLTVICGEDTVASRNHLQQLKAQFKQKGYSIQNTTVSELPDILKSNEGVVDLFGQESVYIVENVSSKYKGRGKTDFKTAVDALGQSDKFHVVDWESGKSAYELSALKKKASTFQEFKPSQNIFQLLDACYPHNLKPFIRILTEVAETQEDMFIYTLLWRHVRKLIQARENKLDSKTPPWQRGKLTAQANSWSQKTLVNFYEGLVKIDRGMKTNTSTFSIRESIEILACYYLK